MITRRSATALIAACAIAMCAACGGSGNGSGTGATATAPAAGQTAAAAPAVRAVEGTGDPHTAWRFDPQTVTVAAGATVKFTNSGAETHTVTADDGSFDAGTVDPGQTVTLKFDHAGSFGYHCSLHPWMTGTVKVTPA
jgi:plastocyanin